MATTKRPKDDAAFDEEDTEDIVNEVAERDEDGNLVIDEDTLRRVGAVDSESIRTNRRRRTIAGKRRTKQKFQFDTDDPLDKYDILLRSAPASSFYIKVKRMTGPELSDYIRSGPASGLELFEAVKAIHGQNPSYQYRLEIMTCGAHTNAAGGRVTVPDTRPMHMREPTNPYQQPFQQAPVAQPVLAAPPNPANPVEQFGQMFEMFQRFSGQQASSVPSSTQQQQPDMMQMFELFMKMRGNPAQQPVQPVVQAPPPPPQPDMMAQMSQMLELLGKFQAMQQRPEPRVPRSPMYDPDTGEPVRRRFGGGGPPYNGYQPSPQQQQQPPQRSDGFDGFLEQAEKLENMKRKMAAFLGVSQPQQQQQQEVDDDPEPDNDPFYTHEIGKVKVVRKRDDDEVQPWATVAVNAPDALKWVTDTYEKFKKEAEARKQQEARQQRRVLPPGYVEVIPGQPIQAPQGYVAVPVSEEEVQAVQQPVITPEPELTQELPPVPENIPPPIQEDEAWSQPIIPSRGRD